MNIKVVIKRQTLHGSNGPQKFHVVYIDRREFRVYAPPNTNGNALEWLRQCVVHETEGADEFETIGAPAVLVLRSDPRGT